MTIRDDPDPASRDRPRGTFGVRPGGRPQGWLPARYWPGARTRDVSDLGAGEAMLRPPSDPPAFRAAVGAAVADRTALVAAARVTRADRSSAPLGTRGGVHHRSAKAQRNDPEPLSLGRVTSFGRLLFLADGWFRTWYSPATRST